MPCGLSSSSRSEEGFLGAHMSTLSLHLCAQNARGTGQSLHGLTGQQEVDQGWLWGGIVHGDIYPGQLRGPDIAVVHTLPKKIENTARNPPSKIGESRHTLQAGGQSVG